MDCYLADNVANQPREVRASAAFALLENGLSNIGIKSIPYFFLSGLNADHVIPPERALGISSGSDIGFVDNLLSFFQCKGCLELFNNQG